DFQNLSSYEKSLLSLAVALHGFARILKPITAEDSARGEALVQKLLEKLFQDKTTQDKTTAEVVSSLATRGPQYMELQLGKLTPEEFVNGISLDNRQLFLKLIGFMSVLEVAAAKDQDKDAKDQGLTQTHLENAVYFLQDPNRFEQLEAKWGQIDALATFTPPAKGQVLDLTRDLVSMRARQKFMDDFVKTNKAFKSAVARSFIANVAGLMVAERLNPENKDIAKFNITKFISVLLAIREATNASYISLPVDLGATDIYQKLNSELSKVSVETLKGLLDEATLKDGRFVVRAPEGISPAFRLAFTVRPIAMVNKSFIVSLEKEPAVAPVAKPVIAPVAVEAPAEVARPVTEMKEAVPQALTPALVEKAAEIQLPRLLIGVFENAKAYLKFSGSRPSEDGSTLSAIYDVMMDGVKIASMTVNFMKLEGQKYVTLPGLIYDIRDENAERLLGKWVDKDPKSGRANEYTLGRSELREAEEKSVSATPVTAAAVAQAERDLRRTEEVQRALEQAMKGEPTSEIMEPATQIAEAPVGLLPATKAIQGMKLSEMVPLASGANRAEMRLMAKIEMMMTKLKLDPYRDQTQLVRTQTRLVASYERLGVDGLMRLRHQSRDAIIVVVAKDANRASAQSDIEGWKRFELAQTDDLVQIANDQAKAFKLVLQPGEVSKSVLQVRRLNTKKPSTKEIEAYVEASGLREVMVFLGFDQPV
ncbi:MAG: hypothetical protein HY767_02410, partial [Candidatus Omnitrophica bacterium]|nr:hypothetical protein [Candidatus Omnitrophota bacterium]